MIGLSSGQDGIVPREMLKKPLPPSTNFRKSPAPPLTRAPYFSTVKPLFLMQEM